MIEKSALDYYLLDTLDSLIEKLFMWKSSSNMASIYDKGLVYGFCCAMVKLYREISDFGLTDRLSDKARRFDPKKLINDLKLPPCSQKPRFINKLRDNFLFSILSKLLCDAIDLRDQSAKEQNELQKNWLHGQYFGHYSVITRMMNLVLAFDLFRMLPDSWHWEKFDPDTLHNGITKAYLGL